MRAWLGLWICLSVSCIPALETDGRACGCPEDYRCVDDVCVPSDGSDAGPVRDAPEPDVPFVADAGSDARDSGVDSSADAGCTLPIVDTPPAPLRLHSGRLSMHGASCLVQRDGRLFCWGRNPSGELGSEGGCGASGCLREVVHPLARSWSRVTSGISHTCATDMQGDIYCWGDNGYLQLGRRDLGPEVATHVSIRARDLASSRHGTCVIKGDSDVTWCWGADYSGQTGVITGGSCAGQGGGTLSPEQRISWSEIEACPPIAEEMNIGRWVELSGSGDTMCGLLVDGRAFCWGGTVHGLSGQDIVECKEGCVAQQLGDDAWVHLSQNALHHRCGIRADGELICWGENLRAELGLGYVTEHRSVYNNEGEATEYNACSIEPAGVEDGAWDNARGSEVLFHESEPIPHPAGGEWLRAATGHHHTCALDAAGEVYCWGYNEGFAVDATLPHAEIVMTPSRLDFDWGSRPIEIAAGRRVTCVLTADEAVYCWGETSDRCAGTMGCDAIHRVIFPDSRP